MTTPLERINVLTERDEETGRSLLAMSDAELCDLREVTIAEAQRIAQTGVKHNRSLTENEQKTFDTLILKVEGIDNLRGRRRNPRDELEESFREFTGQTPNRGGFVQASPLALDAEVLGALQAAISSRSAGRFGMAPELRAALSTTDTAGRQIWSANQLAGPRLLHSVAGVPQDLDTQAIQAAFLKAGAIAATGSVGENVAVAEFTSVSPASATLARYGRWTSFSREADIASDAAATLAQAHRRGIARDLDNALLTAVTGVAVTGAVTGTDGLRVAQATIGDALGIEEPQMTIVVHPGKAAVVQDVAPVGGATLAEAVPTFAGSQLYFSSLAPTGSAVVFAGASCRYFQAQPLTMESDLDVKASTLTIATSIIGAYGVDLVNGGARLVTL